MGAPTHSIQRMTSPRKHWHLFYPPTGAALSLLVLVLLAPSVAEAGCSHLVTSKADAQSQASLIGSLIRDLGGPTDPAPVPPGRQPCSGSWCSGHPAVPTVPPGTFEGRLGTWAWCGPIGQDLAVNPSLLGTVSHNPRPLHRGNEVFHPPRPISPA